MMPVIRRGWGYLRRVLRAWSARAVAVRQPGFYQAEEAALNGVLPGLIVALLDGRTGPS